MDDYCESRGNSSLNADVCCGDAKPEMVGNRTEKNPNWSTMMGIPEISSRWNEKSAPHREKPNRAGFCTYGSGRLQSEMSFTNRRRVMASTQFYFKPILMLIFSFSVVPEGDVLSVNLSGQ